MKQHSSIGIIYLLFGIVFCISGFGQELQEIDFKVIEKSIHLKSIGVEEGLPSSETYNVFQDSKGFIWVSTDRGLARYNGENMKVFTVQDGLPDNVVFELFEDSDGWIWIESMNGRASYIKNDTVFLLDSLQTELKLDFYPGQYYNITEDEHGNIWFGYNNVNGLLTKYDKKTGGLSAINIDTSGYNLNAYVKIFNNGNYLYPISNTHNKNTIDNKPLNPANLFSVFTDSTEEHITVDVKDEYPGFGARITKTLRNDFAFSVDQQVCLVYFENGKWIKKILFFNNYVSVIKSDNENNIWIGVINDGVYKFNKENLSQAEHYLSGSTVSGILIDLENNLWLSTLERGVLKSENPYLLKPIELNITDNNKIVDLMVCESALQVGLQNGSWYRFQNSNQYDIKEFNSDLFRFICCQDSLYIKDVTRQGVLSKKWYHNGNIELNQLDIPDKASNGFFSNEINAGWLGNNLLIKAEKTNQYKPVKGVIGKVQSARMINNLFYVGTTNGLYAYNSNDDTLYCYKNKLDVIKIEVYNDRLIFATKGDGVHQLVNNKIEKLSLALPNQSCNDMLVSGDTMYVATGNGVAVVNLLDNTVKLLQKKHGLPSNEVTKLAVFKEYLWVASPRTLSAIPFGVNWVNTVAPNVWVQSIMVNDSSFFNGQELKPDQNNITVHLASSAYKGEVKQFQYKFIDEQNWKSHAGGKLALVSLSPGDYQLQVKAVNSDGISSEKPAVIKFSINRPWYASTWFILLIFVLIIAVVYFVLRVRSRAAIKKIAKEEAYKRQLSEMELKALRAQMNPHFLFNAINSIQYFLIKNKGDEAKGYLSKFSLLVRNVLNHSRQEFITISEEVKGLKLYMDIEKLRFESEFDYEINISSELDEDFDKVPVMMIQPFVENAIWHGLMQKKEGKGKIIVNFAVKEDCIVVSVEDNGIGRTQNNKIKEKQIDNKRTSLGLQIINERINLFNTYRSHKMEFFVIDLYSENNKPQGTKVILYIPFV